jgi:hypothetical protein
VSHTREWNHDMKKHDALTDLTKHLRNRIKAAGIKALVHKSKSGNAIHVWVPNYDVDFSEDQQRTIRQIAVVNRLSWVRGLPIDVEQMTNPKNFVFYLTDEAIERWADATVAYPNPTLPKHLQPRAIRVA